MTDGVVRHPDARAVEGAPVSGELVRQEQVGEIVGHAVRRAPRHPGARAPLGRPTRAWRELRAAERAPRPSGAYLATSSASSARSCRSATCRPCAPHPRRPHGGTTSRRRWCRRPRARRRASGEPRWRRSARARARCCWRPRCSWSRDRRGRAGEVKLVAERHVVHGRESRPGSPQQVGAATRLVGDKGARRRRRPAHPRRGPRHRRPAAAAHALAAGSAATSAR
jgi:hypothetical protein